MDNDGNPILVNPPFEHITKLGKAYRRAWELQLLYIQDLRIRKLCYQSHLVADNYEELYFELQDYMDSRAELKGLPRIIVETHHEKRNELKCGDVDLKSHYGTRRKRGRPKKVQPCEMPRAYCDVDSESSDVGKDDDQSCSLGPVQKNRRTFAEGTNVKIKYEPKFTLFEDLMENSQLYAYSTY